jgi:hypothetical protein
VSEVARTVGPLLETLPPAAAGQLVRLVGNSLSAPPAGLLRDARLGLLVRLLKKREGELVEVRTYEEERLQRRESGEDWPAATTVARAFNGWLGAQLAAMRLACLGTRARTPRCYDHAGSRPAYTTAEVLQVLIDERRMFGVWLLNNEHLEFGEQRRRMAKALGYPVPRIPTNQVFSRLFGGYGEALARAQALTGELPSAPHSDQPPLSLTPTGDDFTAGAERLDPSARLWWHTIRGLPEPDRRYLHRALTRRARTHHSPTAELMLSALKRCIQDQPEDIVSYRGYQTWREAQPDPEEWPTASSIKRLFKRWSVALDDLGVTSTPDLLAWRLAGRNGAFTPQELLATLAAAGDDWKRLHPGQAMPHTAFRGWSIAEMQRSSPRFTRAAIAPATIIKHFGSWHGALTAAGHADLIGRHSSKYRSMPADTVIAFLRQAAEETRPDGRMRRSDYDHWAQDHEHTLQQTDPTAVVPRSQAAINRFGPWPTTLNRCGLTSHNPRRQRQDLGRARYTTQQLRSKLSEALHLLGPTASRPTYTNWRRHRLDLGENWPSASWLELRIGDGRWTTARQRALTDPT